MNVYKSYTQEQLNDQYNTRQQVPDYTNYFDRFESLSRQAALGNTVHKDIFYGDHPKETLDIFPSAIPHSRTMVFIHGGYWHLLDKDMFHFLAGHFLKYDITTVLVNYPLAPRSSIDEIVDSCRKAVRWLHKNIMRYNGNPDELYVLGHSAGGHLASMLLVESEAKFLRAVISLSGIFRLEPVMLSYLNDAIGMDPENASRNSPVFLNPAMDCPLLLAAGTEESDEFKSQTEELYQRWKTKCSNILLINVPHQNHYSILPAAIEKNSILWVAISRFMNINPEREPG